ncbi:CGNR zinc finger domain-containing protein [Kitasatospora sp. NPDC051914]|uniref:CGNR zinc finger domain-containing protein n=1 Tax=Kitasatospora sp. NPDC051914 TaxID=3154945 RepID=UPI003442D646
MSTARPGDDLDLAVALVNSACPLAEPADRLDDPDHLRRAFADLGEPALAADTAPDDLPSLRLLRDRLRGVFAADSTASAARLLNGLLRESNAVPQLPTDGEGPLRLDWGADRRGYPALAARLPGALAAYVAEHGVRRLGSCAAAPCSCVFVDRTRPGNRRFCCDQCTDRAAASAYRGRRRAR